MEMPLLAVGWGSKIREKGRYIQSLRKIQRTVSILPLNLLERRLFSYLVTEG